jgi:hypothetical protein
MVLFYLVSTLIIVLTRLTLLAFFIVSCITIPQLCKVANNADFELITDNTTDTSALYVPLQICARRSARGDILQIDNTTTLSYSVPTETCESLDYLLKAAMMSFGFAMVACLFFLFFDMIARNGLDGPITLPAVRGMSLFLIFSLLQVTACGWTVAHQCEYWIEFYNEQFYGRNWITYISTFGDPFYFWLGGAFALAGACLLLFDSLLGFCGADKLSETKSKKKKENRNAAREETGEPEIQL